MALHLRSAVHLKELGLDPAGVPPATLEEQLEQLWANISTILASAGMTVDNIVRVTSYLQDVADAETNGAARVAALCGRVVPATAIVVQTLSDAWARRGRSDRRGLKPAVRRLPDSMNAAGGDYAPAVSSTPAPVRVVQADNGFDWGDAGIGAGGLLALAAIASGALVAIRHRPDARHRVA